jgi:hypothetical protein
MEYVVTFLVFAAVVCAIALKMKETKKKADADDCYNPPDDNGPPRAQP